MADLAAFRMTRAPERVAIPGKDYLDLGDGAEFVQALLRLLPKPEPIPSLTSDRTERHRLLSPEVPPIADGERSPADAARALAEDYLKHFELDLSAHPILRLLSDLDRWLSSKGNRPAPAELDTMLAAALEQHLGLQGVVLDDLYLDGDLSEAWNELVDLLCAALLVPERWSLGQQVTRLLLVFGLLVARLNRDGAFNSADDVFAMLRFRTPLLPKTPFPALLPPNHIRLVRQAAISDLFVVRSEWRCYEAAEVADITNVLTGESYRTKRLRIDEQEITETVTDERVTIAEQTEDVTERSELAEETQREVDLAVHIEGQVDTSGQYGPTLVQTSLGGSFDYSVSDATRRASQIGREAVTRAVARVETRRRTERVERLLTRTEATDVHAINNRDGKNLRGVYRWVNRIDRYQVMRYPDRFQLEFQFPEPGNALIRLLADTRNATVKDPGEFDLDIADITVDNWATLVSTWGVAGVPAPPAPQVYVAANLVATSSTQTSSQELWSVDPAEVSEAVVIPQDYEAVQVTVKTRPTRC